MLILLFSYQSAFAEASAGPPSTASLLIASRRACLAVAREASEAWCPWPIIN